MSDEGGATGARGLPTLAPWKLLYDSHEKGTEGGINNSVK